MLFNIKNVNLTTEIVYVPCRGRSPALQVQDFIKKIPKQLYDTVWLYANADSVDEICQWDEQNLQQNVRIMIDFVTQFTKNGIKLGFLASEEYWENMFGGCLLFKDFPLFWYPEQPNNTPSFEDFKSFADWKTPK